MTKIIKSKHKEGRKRLTCFSRNENSSFFSKPYKPGPHKSKNKPSSTFGILLNEKQKLKISYNLSEKKIKNIFNKVAEKHKPADRVSEIMKLISLRFDRVIYDALFGISIYEAGQMVSHCHFTVNEKSVNKRGFELKVGDIVKFVSTGALTEKVKENIKKCESKFPAYLKVDENSLSIEVIRQPDLNEITNIAKIDIPSAIQALSR